MNLKEMKFSGQNNQWIAYLFYPSPIQLARLFSAQIHVLPCNEETLKYISSGVAAVCNSELIFYPGPELFQTNVQVFFIPSSFDVFEFECGIKD